ncbi:MAG: hypothetical protein ACYC5H_03490 [Methylovirgula sp.]
MTIRAYYPSRGQPRRHNLLFARAHRARRSGLILTTALGFFAFFVLHIGLNAAAAKVADRGRPPSVSQVSSSGAWRQHVRIIPLFHIPKDVAIINSIPSKQAL